MINCILKINGGIIINQNVINSKMNLYIEIALAINRDMFESKYIPYKIYQITEDALLKKVKDAKINKKN